MQHSNVLTYKLITHYLISFQLKLKVKILMLIFYLFTMLNSYK